MRYKRRETKIPRLDASRRSTKLRRPSVTRCADSRVYIFSLTASLLLFTPRFFRAINRCFFSFFFILPRGQWRHTGRMKGATTQVATGRGHVFVFARMKHRTSCATPLGAVGMPRAVRAANKRKREPKFKKKTCIQTRMCI